MERVAFSPMGVPVVSNVDARPNMEAGAVVDLLFRQMFSPVLWEDCVRTMAARGVELFFEVGPQKVLTNMMKRIVARYPLPSRGNDGGDRGGAGGARVKGKVTIVTGASQGIGRAIAELLAEKGADIAMLDVADGAEAVRAVEAKGVKAAIP